jgi:hypothetical protein
VLLTPEELEAINIAAQKVLYRSFIQVALVNNITYENAGVR